MIHPVDQTTNPAVGESLRILFIEDSEDDARLIIRRIRRGGFVPEYERVETAETLRKALTQKNWDLILCDYKMPQFDGLHALEIYKEVGIDIPFIIVSGKIGEDIAVAAIKAGADDYLLKDNLTRLVPAVERALKDADARAKRRQAEEALRDSEARYRSVVAAVGDGIILQEASGRILDWNLYAEEVFGLKAEEVLGRTWVNYPCTTIREDGSLYPADRHPSVITMQTGKACDNEIMGLKKADGDVRWISINTRPLFREGDDKPQAVVISFSDFTERLSAERELARAHSQMRALTVRLQEIREQERKAIALAIHDEMGQALTGLKMEIGWIKNLMSGNREIDRDRIVSRLESMGQLTDATVREMRRIITELRPTLLDDLGLFAALQWLTQEYGRRTGTPCSFHSPSEPLEISPERAIAAFRIAQEAINNILRHAKATNISLTVRIEAGQLLLTVIDDGCGFSEADVKMERTYGILGMKERAFALDGAVDVRSMPDIGTTVSVRIPLAPPGGSEVTR